MVFLTRHGESIKARLCFAFQKSCILFQSFHYNPLQALNLFELLLLLCTKSFLKFSGFLNLENLCYSSSSFSSPFAKKNSPRTNRLNSLVSPFSLVKEFKTTQSENSFDSSHSLIQKRSKV